MKITVMMQNGKVLGTGVSGSHSNGVAFAPVALGEAKIVEVELGADAEGITGQALHDKLQAMIDEKAPAR
jgi:hypothetical protein